MPTSTQLSNPDFASQLNIESLIAAPLIAASKANVVMVTGQVRALLENCFRRNGSNYEPVMINMVLSRTELDTTAETAPGTPPKFKRAELQFAVPLITIVPINNLVVEKVDVDFDLEITAVYHKPSSSNLADGDPINEKKAVLHGRIANRKSTADADDEEKGSARLKVNIHASPLPLPTGLLNILDLYSKSIHPLPQ